MRIVVTGGSGKAGRWVVRDLREPGTTSQRRHGPTEPARPVPARRPGRLRADREALAGADAVVHLAAIPAPGIRPPATRSATTSSRPTTCSRRPRRPASSASSGPRARPSSACRSTRRPPSRRSTRPRTPPGDVYALSKLAGETLAAQFNRRTGIPIVGLRISNIMEPDDYARFPTFWDDATLRRWNLWGYVDAGTSPRPSPRPRGRRDRGRGLHRRRGRHRDDPAQRRPHGRGLPRRAAHARGQGPRDPPVDRARAPVLGYSAGTPLGRPRGDTRDGGSQAQGRGPDNPAERRYEAWVDGELAGLSEYEPRDGWLVFHHTEVKPEYEGKGVGSQLAKGALDDVRARGSQS